jgi:hypothetical protein
MLILDKRRAIERIMALSEVPGQLGDGGEPPKGARQRVAAFTPHPAASAVRPALAAAVRVQPRGRRRQDKRAGFPVEATRA